MKNRPSITGRAATLNNLTYLIVHGFIALVFGLYLPPHLVHLLIGGEVALLAFVLPGEADEVLRRVDAASLEVHIRHCEHDVVGVPSQGSPHLTAALAVPSQYPPHLPELKVVKELTAGEPYLADEQFVDVAGGQAFFPSSSLS